MTRQAKPSSWQEAVREKIDFWLRNSDVSYFDIRAYLNSWDLGIPFLWQGKPRLFLSKIIALAKPRAKFVFADELPPSRENSVAIVVTFSPDEVFFRNIKLLQSQFRRVIIVDNTPEPSQALQFEVDEKTVLLINRNRYGLAGALNMGLREIYRSETRGWFFCFDQDTEVHPDFLTRLQEIIARQSAQDSLNSLYGINYEDGKTPPRVCEKEVLEVYTVITSGSFCRIENLTRLGLVVDELFIDSIDHEYCLRARRMGLRVRWISIPLMKHALGRIELRKILWKKRVIVTNHAPFRWYYFTRNYIFTFFESGPSGWLWSIAHGWSLLKNFLKMSLFEDSKTIKVRSFLRGFCSGLLLIFGIDRRY